MPRTCIICGASANSREHIFPAALGGLRTNRGIYCSTHNNAFSGLAGVLTTQLGMWNALLGVRDRNRQARVLNLTTPGGDEVIVSTGQVRRAPTSPVDPEEGIHLQLSLGGPEGLPAIGYVALTFFAHHFGDAARQDGLAQIKTFIQGHAENEFVWWESETTTRGLPPNPFAFGHTIILTTSVATGKARAIISLFQTLTFGITLGQIDGATDQTVTVFIDPHAEREPVDTQERRSDTVELQIEQPRPMHAHLERMVHQGHGQQLLQDLMGRIERWQFSNEMQSVLASLNATVALPIGDRVHAVRPIVEEQTHRLYRLMRYVVKDFRQRSAGQPELQPLLPLLEAQIGLNDTGDGLNEVAEIPAVKSVVAFIRELSNRLSQGPIDMEYLWMLFSGGTGAHLVAQAMFEPITAFLNDPTNLGPEEA